MWWLTPSCMARLKGSTARQANLILGRTGEAFWQDESFDHRVRDEVELDRIVRYVEHNPASAGLWQRIHGTGLGRARAWQASGVISREGARPRQALSPANGPPKDDKSPFQVSTPVGRASRPAQ